jgi:hypothetical protein
MNEFEELQNLWQNQGLSQQNLPIENPKISKNVVAKIKQLQKRWLTAGIGGTIGLSLTILFLVLDIWRARYTSWLGNSGNLLIISGLAFGIYTIWHYNYFTLQSFGKPTLEFIEQKIKDIKQRSEFISYFIFFSESGLTLGLNFHWWEDFSFYNWQERFLAHSALSIGTIVVFEVIKSIAYEKYEAEIQPVLKELEEIKDQLNNELENDKQ